MDLDDTLTLEMDSQKETTLLIDTDVHSPLENTDIKQEPDFHSNGDGAKLSEHSKYAVNVDVLNIKTEIIDNDSYQNVDTRYNDGICSNSSYIDIGIRHGTHVTLIKSESRDGPLETTDRNDFFIVIDTCKDEYYDTHGYPNSHANASLEDNQQRESGVDCGRNDDIHIEHGDPQLGQGASHTFVDKNPLTAALSGIQCTYPNVVSQSAAQVPAIEPPIQLHGQSTEYVNPFQQSKHKPYMCPECGVGFAHKRNMNIHMRIHIGEKPHKCSVCEVSFTQKCRLTSHMRIHTGEKPYTCSVCGVGFAHASGLKYHTSIHTGEKPHECSVCEVRFKQKCDLISHTRTHTGEKPYKCSVCGVAFTQKQHLKIHTTTHTGEKSHKCTVCEVSFADKGHFTRHMRTHTGEKPYKCPVCGIRLGHANTLKKHMARHDRSRT